MASDRTTEELARALEARAEYWRNECSRLMYGSCQTLACLKRGGWVRGDPVDYDMATCETFQACNIDRAAAARLRELEAAVEPFAKAADIKLCGEWRDDQSIQPTDTAFYVTFGDLRRARRALTGGGHG
ncbi:MAG: hypothetical protein EBR82_48270 [Caulobacteraceae bacterium]|nr:hypothetical protein [Caulobacteraceae bacterium]